MHLSSDALPGAIAHGNSPFGVFSSVLFDLEQDLENLGAKVRDVLGYRFF
ncbi:hypothetical protein [Fowl aviadenovirus 4]|nr:hypothetical protein [Fowl aviadenovirus 4]WQI83256.1 hypothetical protein [Fowl aviadenovirus C]ULR92067.1 hypothetical protein [Fowl aviadenovirus 4]ULR92107.1 hypothetical protein [Fowl aviadenovirus 4]ULR92146.1 hypothetical protein [Fowl aviadenovirus 4]